LDLGTAVAVLDLAYAGVNAEMAEAPYCWDEQAAPQIAPVAAALVADALMPRMAVAQPEVAKVTTKPEIAPLMPREVKVAVAEPVAAAPEVVAETEVNLWKTGDAGGTVVVVQGDEPPAGTDLALLHAILAAVGLKSEALGLVGFAGRVTGGALVAEVLSLSPVRVLVLGQEALTAILGTKAGVEGWHAGARGALPVALDNVGVGVTYPLALLVRQPLFKRLAWRHVLAWRTARGFEGRWQ
jgi:hypothetical protein